MQDRDRNEMDNRRMHDRDRERDWEREPGTSYQRERREYRDRPEREFSYQGGRRDEQEASLPYRESNWENRYPRRGDNEPFYANSSGTQYGASQSGSRDFSSGREQGNQYGNREFGSQYGGGREERGSRYNESQPSSSYWGGGSQPGGSQSSGSQWGESQYGSQWGSQGRGDYGNQRPGEGNRGRDWSDQQSRQQGSGRFSGGMGTYGGGLSDFGSERGRHSGRGPKGYQRSDDRIREDVCERLTHHPEIDASEIDVKVSNGEVTLSGSVDERNAKRMAEEIAEQISGVKDVHNQIRYQQQTANVGQGSHSMSTSGSQQNKTKS
jgi:osmotically-inducible protein OsmY